MRGFNGAQLGLSNNDYGQKSTVTKMTEELNWKPLHQRRREHILVSFSFFFFYKIINNLVAVPIKIIRKDFFKPIYELKNLGRIAILDRKYLFYVSEHVYP